MYKTFDPQKAILGLYSHLGSWRAVAQFVGSYSPGYWCAVARGRWRASRAAENALRRRLGLAPRGVMRLAEMPTGELRWYLEHRRPVTRI